MSNDENAQKTFIPGKQKKGSTEHFYTKEEVKEMIPFLRYQNNQGQNILITPMDDEAYYLLLDDARISKEELKKGSFTPCLVQDTSWASTQMLFKVPKTLDRTAVLAVCQQMNQNHGDPKMQALRQPLRLAGFRNMKAKHLNKEGLYPFVKVVSAVNAVCQRCISLVRKVELFTNSQAQQQKESQLFKP